MTDDERAIRALVDTWMEATTKGDTATVLPLMTDDVVFTVAGQEPFGKEAFAKSAGQTGGMEIDGTNEIVELRVLGEWAFIRNRISLTVTPAGAETAHRSGYTLTLLNKGADGQWRVARDANLLTPDD